MANWLSVLESAEAEWAAAYPQCPDGMPADEFYPCLTLALGLRKVRANLEWCEECITLVSKRLKEAATRA